VLGAVLVGGQSRRFGTDKALADLSGRPLGSVAVTALRNTGIDPVVAVGGVAGQQLGLVTVPDRYPGQGPLGGLISVLAWARVGSVLLTTCDLAHITANDVGPLLEQAARLDAGPDGPVPVVATVEGRPDPSLALWPTEMLSVLLDRFGEGKRAFRAALDGVEWVGVDTRAAALADVDRPEDLDFQIERLDRPSADSDATERSGP
jgi:molybdopterin-guanine dinucleotide biosynthesis protein A